MDPELAGFIGRRADHAPYLPPPDDDGLALEFGIVQDFHRGIKGIDIQMKDGFRPRLGAHSFSPFIRVFSQLVWELLGLETPASFLDHISWAIELSKRDDEGIVKRLACKKHCSSMGLVLI
jgi:hypothetical protein